MAAFSSLATAALVTSAVAGVASTGYSIYQSQKQSKEAAKQQKIDRIMQAEQANQIAQEKQNALDERKGLLSKQRYQMGLDSSYSTSGTSSVGRGLTTGESTLG